MARILLFIVVFSFFRTAFGNGIYAMGCDVHLPDVFDATYINDGR